MPTLLPATRCAHLCAGWFEGRLWLQACLPWVRLPHNFHNALFLPTACVEGACVYNGNAHCQAPFWNGGLPCGTWKKTCETIWQIMPCVRRVFAPMPDKRVRNRAWCTCGLVNRLVWCDVGVLGVVRVRCGTRVAPTVHGLCGCPLSYYARAANHARTQPSPPTQ